MLRLANKKSSSLHNNYCSSATSTYFLFVLLLYFCFVLLEMIRLIKEYVPGPISQLVHQYV